MNIVKSTVKGQILIPAPLRNKYGIGRGTALRIYDEWNRIVVEPVADDPVAEGKGLLKTKGKVLKALMKDRKEESRR